MNFSMKPHHLVAHWVPGSVVVFSMAAVICLLFDYSLAHLLETGPILLLTLATFMVGQLIDTIRVTWVEELKFLNNRGRINWDFFFECKDQRLENLENYFYVYYVFDLNILIAFVLSLIVYIAGLTIGVLLDNPLAKNLVIVSHVGRYELFASMIVSVLIVLGLRFIYRNAMETRLYIARFTYSNQPPHNGVFTRLKPSKVDPDGVGVFAITNIPKGTDLFAGDDSDVVWLEATELYAVPPNIRKMYDDFCIIKERGRRYGSPKNFNCMTISWFVNHSKTPNVEWNSDRFAFIANQDIPEGEEITVDEDTYNEWKIRPSYLG